MDPLLRPEDIQSLRPQRIDLGFAYPAPPLLVSTAAAARFREFAKIGRPLQRPILASSLHDDGPAPLQNSPKSVVTAVRCGRRWPIPYPRMLSRALRRLFRSGWACVIQASRPVIAARS